MTAANTVLPASATVRTLGAAPASTAGIAFQFQRAVLHLADAPPDAFVGIETLDDIASISQTTGEIYTIEQDKFSITPGGYAFYDKHPAIWKTLRNWLLAARQTVQGDDGLEDRLKALRAEYVNVRNSINEKKRRELEENAHRALSRLISIYAEFFGAEGYGDNPEIDGRELTIRFLRTRGGRKDLLYEIGSGSNWMAYHMSALLALHEFVLFSMDRTPIPSFLVIDQPSQVYFPADTYDSAEKGQYRPPRYDEDLRNTRRIFEALNLALQRTQGKVQIILTEHADHLVWSGLEHVHEVANWHSDSVDYLVPRDWLNDNKV